MLTVLLWSLTLDQIFKSRLSVLMAQHKVKETRVSSACVSVFERWLTDRYEAGLATEKIGSGSFSLPLWESRFTRYVEYWILMRFLQLLFWMQRQRAVVHVTGWYSGHVPVMLHRFSSRQLNSNLRAFTVPSVSNDSLVRLVLVTWSLGYFQPRRDRRAQGYRYLPQKRWRAHY